MTVKQLKSKDIRTKRVIKMKELISKGKPFNKNICNECGFRIRSENHCNGSHHINNIVKLED